MGICISSTVERGPVVPLSLRVGGVALGCGIIRWPVASVARAGSPVLVMLPQASGHLAVGRGVSRAERTPGPVHQQYQPSVALPSRPWLLAVCSPRAPWGWLRERQLASSSFNNFPALTGSSTYSGALRAGLRLPLLPSEAALAARGRSRPLPRSLRDGGTASPASHPPSPATSGLTVAQ